MELRDKMMQGLDIVKPDWFICFATQQELADCVRACTDGHSGTVKAKNKLRREVCERMYDVLRGAYEGGVVIVKEVETA